jgi:aminopeptidase-like protein
MSLARSAGQALYDLAVKDIDALVGSRERFGALIYGKYLEKDEPTPYFFKVWNNLHPHSMVANNEVSFVATMARVATIAMLSDGSLHAVKEDRNKG